MGLFDELWDALTPEQKKSLAKEAGERAVKGVGDAVYERFDKIREDFESAAEARRDAKRREVEAERKVEQAKRDEQAIDDELAALKAALAAEKKTQE